MKYSMGKLLILCLVSVLCSCSHIEFDYGDFGKEHILWNEVLNYEDRTFVYFYSTYCGHCKSVKKLLLKFANSNKSNFKFCKETGSFVYKTTRENIIGCENISDFYICGTPSLLIVESKSVKEYYLGENEIIGYIRK
jgi:thiol-disulfide isomerase/thioredoxin